MHSKSLGSSLAETPKQEAQEAWYVNHLQQIRMFSHVSALNQS